MSKRKNKRTQPQPQKRAQQTSTSATVAVEGKKSEPVQQEAITVDEVTSSRTEAEFQEKKEALIFQFMSEIEELGNNKESAEKAAAAAQAAVESVEQDKKRIEGELTELRRKLGELKKSCDEADRALKDAIDQKDAAVNAAQTARRAAESEAQKIRDKAEQDRISTLSAAAEEARNAWKNEADKLAAQLAALAETEGTLKETERKLKKEKHRLEDDQEAIEEERENLRRLKERYDAASPSRIASLEVEIADEHNRYQALMAKYQELSERLEKLQVLMDTVKLEIDDPEHGHRITSMNEIVTALQELRARYDKLDAVYKRYSYDDIATLEDKARAFDTVERENEALTQERDRYRAEAAAARNVNKELEVVKQEVEATNALNEHLLRELESHKTALESRTGDTCPSLTKVDTETDAADFKSDITKRMQRPAIETLPALVSHVKNYAGSRPAAEQLFYTDNDIRAFLAGMAVSRLIILQGMSGTGKSSLPRIFSEAISGFDRLIPVESSWRDRNELLGYYNDFNKKFNAKSFTIELYRSGKEICRTIPTFIVLDEMNLARIEYYFSDFLAILQEPDHEKWLIELVSSDMRTLPMELPENVKAKMKKDDPRLYEIWEKIERSRQGDLRAETSDEDKQFLTTYLAKLNQLTGAKGLIDGRKIKVTDNIWFIGTANRDESTFEISDKVYDRAQVVSLNRKGKSEGKYIPTKEKYISVTAMQDLFESAIKAGKCKAEVERRLTELDNKLMEYFDISFGNRIVTQTIDFVAVFVAAGGTLVNALDYQISTKILRKVISSDDAEALSILLDATKDYPETQRLINKRIKELR